MIRSISIGKTFILLLSALLVLLVLSSLGFGNFILLNHIESGMTYKLFQLFNLDFERNIPTWFSAMLLTINGLSLLLIAFYAKVLEQRYTLHWFILSMIFFILSMDEFIQFHEQIIRPVRTLLDTDKFLYNAWIIPAGIALIPLGLFYLPFILKLPKTIQMHFLVAGLLYVGGVIGMEAISGNYYSTALLPKEIQYDWVYLLLTNFEEFLEMTGLIVFLSGNFTYLSHLSSLIKNENMIVDSSPLIVFFRPVTVRLTSHDSPLTTPHE